MSNDQSLLEIRTRMVGVFIQKFETLNVKYVLMGMHSDPLSFPIFLPDFGSIAGIGIDVTQGVGQVRTVYGKRFIVSEVNFEFYSSAGLDEYVEMLKDWGYFGQMVNRPNFVI
ncbi:hypothetical protein [Asticcacaulis benevestitus]|nr:hypothetical protein [Asticcacaulis benevestitus]